MTNLLAPAYYQLLTTGLSRWIPALMIVLHQYEGIERALEPEEHPTEYLSNTLGELQNIPVGNREEAFFDILSTMPLLYYRVAGDGQSWHPKLETLQQFEQRLSKITIWQTWTPSFTRDEIMHWPNANLPIVSSTEDAWFHSA